MYRKTRKRGVISFDKGGSKQIKRINDLFNERLRNRKLIPVLHREFSFRGDEGDRRVSDWVSRG